MSLTQTKHSKLICICVMIWGLVGDSKENACYRKKRERKKENVLIVQLRISSTLAAEDERKLIRLKRLSRTQAGNETFGGHGRVGRAYVLRNTRLP